MCRQQHRPRAYRSADLRSRRQPKPVEDFLVFHRKAANFPWVSHALWLYAQMVRWRQVAPSKAAEAAVRRVFRPTCTAGRCTAVPTPVPPTTARSKGARRGGDDRRDRRRCEPRPRPVLR